MKKKKRKEGKQNRGSICVNANRLARPRRHPRISRRVLAHLACKQASKQARFATAYTHVASSQSDRVLAFRRRPGQAECKFEHEQHVEDLRDDEMAGLRLFGIVNFKSLTTPIARVRNIVAEYQLAHLDPRSRVIFAI